MIELRTQNTVDNWECFLWCGTNVKRRAWYWYSHTTGEPVFQFVHEEDAIAFKLKFECV